MKMFYFFLDLLFILLVWLVMVNKDQVIKWHFKTLKIPMNDQEKFVAAVYKLYSIVSKVILMASSAAFMLKTLLLFLPFVRSELLDRALDFPAKVFLTGLFGFYPLYYLPARFKNPNLLVIYSISLALLGSIVLDY